MRAVDNKRRWYLVFTLLLAGSLLFLAVRGVNWHEMLMTLRQAKLQYVALGCAVASVSYSVRGLRWWVLLGAKREIPPLTVFWAAMVGYLANSFLPARAGELIRSAMLGLRLAISTSFVLATALTERIMDAVALVLISSVALLSMEEMPELLAATVKLMAGLSLVALVGLLVAPSLRNWFKRVFNWLPLPSRWQARLWSLIEQFLFGMRAIRHPGRTLGFIGLTGGIWLMDAAGSILCAQALNLTLTLPQALLFLAALGLASAMPSTPGYVGIYQFVAVTVLAPFGLARSDALAFALVAQAGTYLVVTVWGMLGLWRLGYVWRNRERIAT